MNEQWGKTKKQRKPSWIRKHEAAARDRHEAAALLAEAEERYEELLQAERQLEQKKRQLEEWEVGDQELGARPFKHHVVRRQDVLDVDAVEDDPPPDYEEHEEHEPVSTPQAQMATSSSSSSGLPGHCPPGQAPPSTVAAPPGMPPGAPAAPPGLLSQTAQAGQPFVSIFRDPAPVPPAQPPPAAVHQGTSQQMPHRQAPPAIYPQFPGHHPQLPYYLQNMATRSPSPPSELQLQHQQRNTTFNLTFNLQNVKTFQGLDMFNRHSVNAKEAKDRKCSSRRTPPEPACSPEENPLRYLALACAGGG